MTDLFRVAQLRRYDVANGPGIRASLFVSGCRHRCPGCFNEAYQDFGYGTVWDTAQEAALIEHLATPELSGLTVLGGEPMHSAKALTPVVQRIRETLRPDQTIWLYSGDRYEQIMVDPVQRALLDAADVLVDGLFVASQADPRLAFRGSRNQRMIDIARSREGGRAIWVSGYENAH